MTVSYVSGMKLNETKCIVHVPMQKKRYGFMQNGFLITKVENLGVGTVIMNTLLIGKMMEKK